LTERATNRPRERERVRERGRQCVCGRASERETYKSTKRILLGRYGRRHCDRLHQGRRTRASATGSGIHLAAAQQLAVRRVGEEAVVRRRMHRPAPAAQGFRPSLEGGCGRGGLNCLRKRLPCAVLRRACGSLVYIVGPEPEGDVAAQLHVVDAHLARARAHRQVSTHPCTPGPQVSRSVCVPHAATWLMHTSVSLLPINQRCIPTTPQWVTVIGPGGPARD
jgi:hypothetical protein